jgi:hypothetical protein
VEKNPPDGAHPRFRTGGANPAPAEVADAREANGLAWRTCARSSIDPKRLFGALANLSSIRSTDTW